MTGDQLTKKGIIADTLFLIGNYRLDKRKRLCYHLDTGEHK
jgi:hypothetical protein